MPVRGLLLALVLALAAAPAARADDDPAAFAHQTSPPVVLSTDADDSDPAVAVDTNGTAYVVWMRSGDNSVRYCRLPRGATACDVSKFFTGPSSSDPLSQARVVLEGPGKPDVVYNRATDDALFIRRSTDGGANFTARTAFGTGVPESVVAGPGSSLSISRGAGYYGMEYGDYPLGGSASSIYLDGSQVGEPSPLFDGGVGLVDSTTPIVAYTDHTNSYWRVYDNTHGAAYNNAANWKPRGTLAGSPDARLTSGVDGVFVQTRNASGYYEVRRYDGSAANSFGAPVRATDLDSTINYAQLYEDGAGGLHSAWFDNFISGAGFDSPIRYAYSNDGGVTWYRRTLQDVVGEQPQQLQMAAAPDGGGLVVHGNLDSGGIVADVIPTVSSPGIDPPPAPPPTGGGGGGGGTVTPPPTITPPAACQTLAATKTVTVRASTGCLKLSNGRATTTADLRVNGIDFVNPAHKTITVDTKTHTLTIPAGVQAKAGSIVLHGASAGTLDWDLDGTVSFPDAGAAKVNLLGFPIVGDADVKLGNQTAAVTVNVALKPPFSSVTARPVLHTAMNTDLTLDGLSFDIAHVSVGPLLDIGPIHIAYTGTGSIFEGSATVQLPTTDGPSSSGFSAKIGFADGDLSHLDLSYGGPPLPLYIAPPAIFLDEVDFGLQSHNGGLDVGGGVDFSGGPKLFGAAAVEVKGALDLHIPASGAVVLTATGALKIAKIPFGQASLVFSTDGKVSFSGAFGISALEPVIGISVTESGFISISPAQFQADAHAEVTVPANCGGLFCLSGSADGVISSVGFGACGSIGLGPAKVSAGVIWPWTSGPDPYLVGCQSALKDVELGAGSAPPPKPGAPLSGPQQVKVPAGLDQWDAVIQGAGAIPDVTITGPGGRTLTVAGTTPVTGPDDMVGFGIPATAGKPPAAVVMIPKPPAGTYTITPDPGSAPITGVLNAEGQPIPTISGGSVSSGGSGAHSAALSSSRKRVVRFRLGPLHGHTVKLAEEGTGVEHPLGAARAGRNVVKFTLADGPGGKRTVVALIANDTGVVTTKKTIATFFAPAPARPARPRVKVKRSGTTLKLTWKPVRGAKRYAVSVSLSDGRKLSSTTKRAKISVPGVDRAVTGTVSVTAQEGARISPHGTARIRR